MLIDALRGRDPVAERVAEEIKAGFRLNAVQSSEYRPDDVEEPGRALNADQTVSPLVSALASVSGSKRSNMRHASCRSLRRSVRGSADDPGTLRPQHRSSSADIESDKAATQQA